MTQNPRLIVMLTHNDQTILDAVSTFENCIDLPVQYWGFKDVGIPHSEMCRLIDAMKAAGKKTVLEVVTYTEESCMRAARFACEYGFDYLMGTLFFPSVWNFLKTQPIQYFPFVGDVYGSPSVLTGNTEDMVNQANEFYEQDIPGIDILAYRYNNGCPDKLVQQVVLRSKTKTVVAGSIDSVERIKTVKEYNPWGFTMGSALFSQKFVRNAGCRANLERVLHLMDVA